MRVKCCLTGLLLVVSLANQALAGGDLSSQDEGQKLYEQLFRLQDAKYTSFTPDQVMEKLERLIAIFKSNSYDANKPAYKPENQRTINDVYNVITELNCDISAIIKFNELMRLLSIYGNLVRTLNLHRNERFTKCSKEFAKPILNAVEAISKERVSDTIWLRGEILNFLPGGFEQEWPYYTPQAFDKGVLVFLRKHPGIYEDKWKREKMISKSELTSLYDDRITSLCTNLGIPFYEETEFFLKMADSDRALNKLINQDARYWMVNSCICTDALNRRQYVIENVFNSMYSDAHPKRKSLLKWMREESAASVYA